VANLRRSSGLRAMSAYAQAASPQIVKLHVAWKDEAAFHAERQVARRYAIVCRMRCDPGNCCAVYVPAKAAR
jgi:hypothetical protein